MLVKLNKNFCKKKNDFRGISHTCVEIYSIAVIKEEFTC